jgi:hypothetical protein
MRDERNEGGFGKRGKGEEWGRGEEVKEGKRENGGGLRMKGDGGEKGMNDWEAMRWKKGKEKIGKDLGWKEMEGKRGWMIERRWGERKGKGK